MLSRFLFRGRGGGGQTLVDNNQERLVSGPSLRPLGVVSDVVCF